MAEDLEKQKYESNETNKTLQELSSKIYNLETGVKLAFAFAFTAWVGFLLLLIDMSKRLNGNITPL